MKRFLFFAVVATLFAACSKDALDEQQGIQNTPTLPTPANNEIWYTNGSTTEPTAPSETATFGDATIQSNSYDVEKECWVITFDKDIKEIGDSAFLYCRSLTSVTIPDSVTTIGGSAFAGCESLKEFNGKFAADGGRCLIMDNTIIAYANASGTTYTIPNSITTIGSYAFNYCRSLTSVTIPDSVTTIGDWAFSVCDSLTSVTIGDSVTTIGDYAFNSCTSLTSVTIGNSVTTIGDYAFWDCTSLKEFKGKFAADGGRCLIMDNTIIAYADASGTTYTIPDSVTTIGDYAFAGCSLTSVTIPDSVTTIGNSAFSGCTSLTSVTIPDSVTTIGDFAFYDCDSLTSVTIPNSVTTIGNYAFWDCTSLTSVTIGDSVTTIGNYAFNSCTSLKAVYCKPTTPPRGGEYMFDYNASERKIYVPASDNDSIINAYKEAYGWSWYMDYIFEEE